MDFRARMRLHATASMQSLVKRSPTVNLSRGAVFSRFASHRQHNPDRQPWFPWLTRDDRIRGGSTANRYQFFRHLSENLRAGNAGRAQKNARDQIRKNREIKTAGDGPRVRPAGKSVCEA